MRSDHLTKHQRTHRKLMMLATGICADVLENSNDLDGASCLEDSHDNIKDERFSTRSVHLADDFTPIVNNSGINVDT